MTFAQMVTKVTDYALAGSASTETTARVGRSINATYRRVTSMLGLDTSRFVTRSASMTVGVSTVTFTEIEKIDRILDTTDSTAIRLLTQTSIHELRSSQPGSSEPIRWALQNTDADSVTARFDTVPQSAYSLQADGWTTLADLSGSDEPIFPESFHDILVWYVVSEELLKKEKDKLAGIYAGKAEQLLSDLRFYLADSHTQDLRQGGGTASSASGSPGGGAGDTGGTSYTQSGLLTFDRGAGTAPFAVAQADAPYVANLGAEFLGNVTTDRLIGRDTTGTGESEQLTVGGGIEFTGSGGIQRSALTGDVTASAGSAATTIANDAVTTAKILDLNVTTGKIADDAVTYAKIQNISAASRLLGRGSAAGAGNAEEITVAGRLTLAGTVLSVTDGWGLAASAASNILTVALTTKAGATPSSSDPVRLEFRNATAATGDVTAVTVIAATTVVVPDTATLGTSNDTPFNAWIVAFNDGGTVRLGIINCANATSIYPLAAWGLASSTTIGTGADSAQVFYTDAGVTSKAYIVLGYVSYQSGLATAGTYASAPTRAQVYTPDVPLPGRTIQTVLTTYSTFAQSTSSTYADTGSTATITPTSAANKVMVRAGVGGVYKDTADQRVDIQLLRASTQIGYQAAGATGSTATNGVGSVYFGVMDAPATASAVTYKTQFAASGNTASVYVQQAGSQSSIELTEVMA